MVIDIKWLLITMLLGFFDTLHPGAVVEEEEDERFAARIAPVQNQNPSTILQFASEKSLNNPSQIRGKSLNPAPPPTYPQRP